MLERSSVSTYKVPLACHGVEREMKEYLHYTLYYALKLLYIDNGLRSYTLLSHPHHISYKKLMGN